MAIATAHLSLPLSSSPTFLFPAKYHDIAAAAAASLLFSPHVSRRRFDLPGFPTTVSRQIFPSSRPRASSTSNSHGTRAAAAAASPSNTEPMVPPYNVLITGSTKGSFLFSTWFNFKCICQNGVWGLVWIFRYKFTFWNWTLILNCCSDQYVIRRVKITWSASVIFLFFNWMFNYWIICFFLIQE